MIGRTNAVVGGGISKGIAVINAIFKAGYVCSVSDGRRTIKSKNTWGFAAFSIPYAGSWTVSATNGSVTQSKTITVEENQRYDVMLTEFVVYQAGVVDHAMSHGTKRDQGFYMDAIHYVFWGSWLTVCWGGTTDLIKIEEYFTTLHISFYATGTVADHTYSGKFGLFRYGFETGIETLYDSNAAVTWSDPTSAEKTITVDVKNYRGGAYSIGVAYKEGNTDNNGGIYITKIWFT